MLDDKLEVRMDIMEEQNSRSELTNEDIKKIAE